MSCPPRNSKYFTDIWETSKEQNLVSLSVCQPDILQSNKVTILQIRQPDNAQQDEVKIVQSAKASTICQLCYLNLPSAEGYRYHLKRRVCTKRVPNNVKNAVKFHCHNCGTGFTNQGGFDYHLNYHTRPTCTYDVSPEKRKSTPSQSRSKRRILLDSLEVKVIDLTGDSDIEESPPPAKKPRTSCEERKEYVSLYVGPEQKYFRIHKDLLLKQVGYFKELQQKNIDFMVHYMPEIDANMFGVTVGWLYHGQNGIDGLYSVDTTTERFATTRMIRLYCLAEYLGIRQLVDLAMAILGWCYAHSPFWPSATQMKEAYMCTRASSCLRAYMARSCHYLLLHASTGPLSVHRPSHAELEALMAITDFETYIFRMLGGMFDKPLGSDDINPQMKQTCCYHNHRVEISALACPWRDFFFNGTKYALGGK